MLLGGHDRQEQSMTLSPFEVERREFGSAPMGYKKRDVDTFLDEIQRSLRDLWEERGDLREENERLKERLARFEQLEDQLKNTLLLAQDSAEKAHEQARRESELLLREAGQKSRDIVHSAHEEKQKLEMVLRDLHGAEQEARQRLRAMSGAILSHLDDTEQLVNESTANFRAVVQAHPEASELRASNLETMAEHAERAAMLAEAEAAAAELAATAAAAAAESVEVLVDAVDAVATDAQRIELDAAAASDAIDRIVASEETAERRVETLGTDAARSATADAFFDTPPSFDPSEVAPRDRAGSPGAAN
jgi:cell division initiation protein